MKDAFGFEVETDLFGAPKVTVKLAIRRHVKPNLAKITVTLTHEYLRSILRYDPVTGNWRGLPQNRIFVGVYLDRSTRRWRVRIGATYYKSSRLAWFYMTGEWPPLDVDHEENNSSNDKWSNLRLANSLQNAWNKTLRGDNASGFKGVYLQQSSGKYHARIGVRGRKIHLGLFHTKENAAIAYINAAIKYHGEFARAPKKDLF
jgi:hypothetical protein